MTVVTQRPKQGSMQREHMQPGDTEKIDPSLPVRQKVHETLPNPPLPSPPSSAPDQDSFPALLYSYNYYLSHARPVLDR